MNNIFIHLGWPYWNCSTSKGAERFCYWLVFHVDMQAVDNLCHNGYQPYLPNNVHHAYGGMLLANVRLRSRQGFVNSHKAPKENFAAFREEKVRICPFRPPGLLDTSLFSSPAPKLRQTYRLLLSNPTTMASITSNYRQDSPSSKIARQVSTPLPARPKTSATCGWESGSSC
jgi:hypothetical protein